MDSGVLIAAARGSGKLGQAALDIIADAAREFVCSDYVRLEVIPKPKYFGNESEVRFYEEYFKNVAQWLPFDDSDWEQAFYEACLSGLQAMDALHVVVAAGSGCEEIITSERPGSAIHRTKRIQIKTIDSQV